MNNQNNDNRGEANCLPSKRKSGANANHVIVSPAKEAKKYPFLDTSMHIHVTNLEKIHERRRRDYPDFEAVKADELENKMMNYLDLLKNMSEDAVLTTRRILLLERSPNLEDKFSMESMKLCSDTYKAQNDSLFMDYLRDKLDKVIKQQFDLLDLKDLSMNVPPWTQRGSQSSTENE